MNEVYVKLIIAGHRTINTIPPKHITQVAKALIIKGTEDAKTYITYAEVPDAYKNAVAAALEEEGFTITGEFIEA